MREWRLLSISSFSSTWTYRKAAPFLLLRFRIKNEWRKARGKSSDPAKLDMGSASRRKDWTKDLIWANHNVSLTWIKAIWGRFPLNKPWFPVRSQWRRYNIPIDLMMILWGFKTMLPIAMYGVACYPIYGESSQGSTINPSTEHEQIQPANYLLFPNWGVSWCWKWAD